MLAALGLRVNASGAIRQMGKFTHSATNAGRATEKFERSTRNLSATLGMLGGLFGVRQMTEYADTWTLISARIKVTTKETDKQRAIQMRLYDISQKTRNTLAATSVLYTRVALNADQLGRSQEDLLKMTEAVNAATLLSGSTGVEAAQSIRQLAQAMSKGKLDGDEFRTVMEAMPLVARALADEMGVSIGELQALAPKGLLTVQDLIDALINKHEEFVDAVEDMPFTIGQSMELLNNALTMQIGILNEAKGVTETVGAAMRWMSENIDIVISAVAGLVAALVTYKAMMISAHLVQVMFTGAAMIKNWIQLARTMGVVAATANVIKNSAKGLTQFIIMIASVGVGLAAYKILLDETRRATEEWLDAQENAILTDPMGKRIDLETAAQIKTKERIEDMIREAHQQVVLASLVDKMSDKQKIAYDAVNQRVEARRELTGELLEQMEQAIDLEEQLAMKTLGIVEVIEKMQDALKEQEQIVDRFLKNIQRSFADTFAAIMDDGIERFSDLFGAIKKLFTRLIAEMAAAKMMQQFGSSWASGLMSAFGVSQKQEALNQATAQAVTAANAHRAAAQLGGEKGLGGAVPVQIDGITVEASKSWTKYLAPALAGFFAGQLVGKQTSNVGLGTAMGAVSGAAAGFMTGGPWGALIGGLTGAIGGLIGSTERARQEQKLLREQMERSALLMAQNNMRLQEMADFGRNPNRLIKDARETEWMRKFREGIRAGTAIPSDMNTMDAEQRALLIKAAEQLGIDLIDEDTGKLVTGALRALSQALEFAVRDLTQFGESLSEQQKLISARNKIMGIPDTAQQRLTDQQSLLNQLAPDLMKQLGLFNLSLDDKGARETLLAGLREIFTMITKGDLTLDLLGSFADKNQLIDTILATVGALDDLNKVLLNVTTDFPRAMDIVYYEQLYGSFGTRNNKTSRRTTTDTSVRPVVYSNSWEVENVTIVNEGDDTGSEILAKFESAVMTRRTRGGTVVFNDDGGWD